MAAEIQGETFMKKAIFCVALGKKNKMYELSLKTITQYAKKVGAELIVHETPYFNIDWEITKPFKATKKARYAWVEKLYALKLLETYDRVLLLDTDIFITPHAPDIFAAYSDDTKNYVLSESLYDHRPDRDGYLDIDRLEDALGPMPHWPKQGELKRYFNSGVVLFSKKTNVHADFSLTELKHIFNDVVYVDQTYLNYLLFKHPNDVGELDANYNLIAHLHTNRNRHNGYFIHHAVNGYGISKSLKIHTFANDYSRHYQHPIRHALGFMCRSTYSAYLLLMHNVKKLMNKA